VTFREAPVDFLRYLLFFYQNCFYHTWQGSFACKVIILSFTSRLELHIQGMRQRMPLTASTSSPDPDLILSHPPTRSCSSTSTSSSPRGTLSQFLCKAPRLTLVLQVLKDELKTQTGCVTTRKTTTSIPRARTRELISLVHRSMGKDNKAVLEDHTNGTS
jgi:hypothetical protein